MLLKLVLCVFSIMCMNEYYVLLLGLIIGGRLIH